MARREKPQRPRAARPRPSGRRPGKAEARRPRPLTRGRDAGDLRPERQRDETPALVGRHPVREALRAGRSISRVYIQSGVQDGSLREIMALAREAQVVVNMVPRARLDAMAGSLPHQGVAAVAAVKPTVGLDELEQLVRNAEAPPLVLVLDGIQDPQNLGTVIRVANAVGALAVVVPQRGAAGLTSAVARASAGAIEFVPVVQVVNVAQTLQTLKTWGIFVYGADGEAPANYTTVDWRGPVAVVIGAEGKGMRPLVKARCDGLVRLPMMGEVGSLNAATAAAVIGYEVVRQRTAGKTGQNGSTP